MATEDQSEPQGSAQKSPTLPSSFANYSDYIGAIKHTDKIYHWLHHYLKFPGPITNTTNVFAVQKINEQIHVNTATNVDKVNEIIQSGMDGVQEQMVFISYPETWSLNRQILGSVAMRYDLSPLHLTRHLFHTESWTDKSCPERVKRPHSNFHEAPKLPTFLLPSERAVELRFGSGKFALSAFEVENVQGLPKTLVVLCRGIETLRLSGSRTYPTSSSSEQGGEHRSTTKDVWGYLIQVLRDVEAKTLVFSSRNRFLHYLLPFFKHGASSFIEDLDKIGADFEEQMAGGNYSEQSATEFRRSYDNLRESFEISFDSLKQLPDDPLLGEVSNDYRWLSHQIDRFGHDMRRRLDQDVGLMSIRASQMSVDQAEAIKKLSQLAFIFLPLLFASSCISMHGEALSSGRLNIWAFFTTAVSVVLGIFWYRYVIHTFQDG